MSVTILTHQTAKVAGEGARLAEIDHGRLWIWPAGIGNGPAISMDVADWPRISQEVRLAHMQADKLAGYAAQEGNGYE